MKKFSCDYRYLFLFAALPFFYIQMRLFSTQAQYADRITEAIEAETQCTRQTRLLIDQISVQQGRVVSLEEKLKRQEQECRELRSLVQDLQRKSLNKLVGDAQVPVAAVVVMACNRAKFTSLNWHLYVKSDVYSFGVILVEILTGLRVYDLNRPSKQSNLVDWIKPYLHKTKKLKSAMDSRLKGRYDRRSAFHIAQLALKCLVPEPKSRPSMQEIVDAMEGIVTDSPVLEMPR